jgi:hypothetical protein
MINVNTIHNWGGGKNYGSVVVENLDELKKMLIDTNHKYVHLMQKDPWIT